MEIEHRSEGNTEILSCKGRMDAHVSDRLKATVQELLEGGCDRLVLDLEGLEFLDSSGLGALVSCLRRVKERKGQIRLSGLRPEVRSIFDITRVSRLFHICSDVEEAVKSLEEAG